MVYGEAEDEDAKRGGLHGVQGYIADILSSWRATQHNVRDRAGGTNSGRRGSPPICKVILRFSTHQHLRHGEAEELQILDSSLVLVCLHPLFTVHELW